MDADQVIITYFNAFCQITVDVTQYDREKMGRIQPAIVRERRLWDDGDFKHIDGGISVNLQKILSKTKGIVLGGRSANVRVKVEQRPIWVLQAVGLLPGTIDHDTQSEVWWIFGVDGICDQAMVLVRLG